MYGAAICWCRYCYTLIQRPIFLKRRIFRMSLMGSRTMLMGNRIILISRVKIILPFLSCVYIRSSRIPLDNRR